MAHTQEENNRDNLLYHLGDSLLCVFIFFPTMILYWRGIWDLWGVYILPNDQPKQQWVLLAISSIAILGYFLGPLLDRFLDKSNRIPYVIITRLYMYLYAAFYMCYWRALWELADYYFAMDLVGSLINMVCTYTPLLLFRTSRCCIFPPMFVNLDTRDDVLIPTTRFSTKVFTIKYFFDCIFSHFVLLGLTILTWRGMWNFFGAFIIPDNAFLSDIVCLAVGSALILLVFILEEPLASVTLAAEQAGGFYLKLAWEDLVYAAIFLCHGVLWRGGWNLTATYIIPDFEVGGWVCCVSGTIGLTLLQLFSFVGAQGVAIDGADEGRGAFFPTKYLRVYLADHKAQTSYDLQIANTVDNTPGNGEITTISAKIENDPTQRPLKIETQVSLYDNIDQNNRVI